jgi:hypothetical protein
VSGIPKKPGTRSGSSVTCETDKHVATRHTSSSYCRSSSPSTPPCAKRRPSPSPSLDAELGHPRRHRSRFRAGSRLCARLPRPAKRQGVDCAVGRPRDGGSPCGSANGDRAPGCPDDCQRHIVNGLRSRAEASPNRGLTTAGNHPLMLSPDRLHQRHGRPRRKASPASGPSSS